MAHRTSPIDHTIKADIYARFLQKKQQKTSSRRKLVYKPIVYTASTIGMLMFMLFTNFFGLFDYQNITELSQSIVAQSIGKIIESEGTFTIYNPTGRQIDTTQIRLEDRVVVEEGGFVTVLIQDSFTAQVAGPAQFEIKIDDQYASVDYRLHFIQWGDFVEINGIKNLDNQISIQTSDGVVLRKDASSNQRVAFTVENRNNEKTITNHSSDKLDVVIANETSSSNVSIVASSTVNLVNDNNTVIAVEQDTTPVITTKPVTSNPEIIQPTEEIKAIPLRTSSQKNKLSNNLYYIFVKNDLESIVTAYLKWDRTKLQIASTNLNNRLNRIGSLIDHPANVSLSLTSLINHANTILSLYDEHITEYPSNYRNLSRIKTYLSTLQTYEYGLFAEKEDISTLDDMTILLPNLSLDTIRWL